MDKNLELYEQYTLTPGAFDRYSNITPYAIFDIFQDIASRHAVELNAAFNKTNSRCIWLLLRNKFEIVSEITRPIKLIVRTWPLEPKRIDYEREYQVFDLNNNLLVKGTSKWCIFDLDKNQISRSTHSFGGNYLSERNYDVSLNKIELLPFTNDDLAYKFEVTPSLLDINNHMNNAKYSFVLLDSLNLNQDEVIKSVEFNYLKELKPNDLVLVYKKKVDRVYYCYGYVENDLHFSSKVVLI